MDNKTDQRVNAALSSDYVLEHYIKRFTGGLTTMPNNVCNAKCSCCPYPFHRDAKTTMTLETFRCALDSAFEAGHVGTLQFTPMAGEPLADPTLFDKIAYARQKGVTIISFSTNGILFGHKDIYKKIVDANITSVHVSTPGFDPVFYKKTFGVDRCDALIDGLHKLGEYKRSKPECTTRIELSVMLNLPLKELLDLRGWRLLRPYLEDGTFQIAYHSSLQEMLDHHYPPGREHIAPVPPDGMSRDQVAVTNFVDNWSGTVTNEMLPPGWGVKEPTHTTAAVPCWRLLEDVAVLPDGKVRVCSCRYMGTAVDELVIGDVNERPVAEIVFGEKHKALIKDVASGRWPDVCAKCSMYEPVGFTTEEAKFLAAEARWNRRKPCETHAINSVEGLMARAQGKLAFGVALRDAGALDRAQHQFDSAISYAGQVENMRPDYPNLAEFIQRIVKERNAGPDKSLVTAVVSRARELFV